MRNTPVRYADAELSDKLSHESGTSYARERDASLLDERDERLRGEAFSCVERLRERLLRVLRCTRSYDVREASSNESTCDWLDNGNQSLTHRGSITVRLMLEPQSE